MEESRDEVGIGYDKVCLDEYKVDKSVVRSTKSNLYIYSCDQ